MADHWGCMVFKLGETVEEFFSQAEYLGKFKAAKIPWESLGGIFAKEDLVQDVDGTYSIRVPIVVKD